MAAETERSARPAPEPDLRAATERLRAEECVLREGGGADAVARQHEKGRKTARERIAAPDRPGLGRSSSWASGPRYEMYEEWGGAPVGGGGHGHRPGRRAAG